MDNIFFFFFEIVAAHFIELRRSGLERYLIRLVRNPVFRYSELMTTFLGCEDEDVSLRKSLNSANVFVFKIWKLGYDAEKGLRFLLRPICRCYCMLERGSKEFETQILAWKESIKAPSEVVSPASPRPPHSTGPAVQFFSKVFHPDYNVDPIETQYALGAFNKHIRSLETGRGISNVEQRLSKVRASMQGRSISIDLIIHHAPADSHIALTRYILNLDLSSNLQAMSHELARLTAGLALPVRKEDHFLNNDTDVDEDEDDHIEICRHFGHHEPETRGDDCHLAPDCDEDLKILRRKAQDARLQNSEGAMCWRRSCEGERIEHRHLAAPGS